MSINLWFGIGLFYIIVAITLLAYDVIIAGGFSEQVEESKKEHPEFDERTVALIYYIVVGLAVVFWPIAIMAYLMEE